MTKKQKTLLEKAKKQGYLSLDELNKNYADSDKDRIELLKIFKENGIEVLPIGSMYDLPEDDVIKPSIPLKAKKVIEDDYDDDDEEDEDEDDDEDE